LPTEGLPTPQTMAESVHNLGYTKPDMTTVSFQYNDPNPTLITAVLDSNGKVLESHTYDSQARGLTSSRAGGVEAVTIKYPPAQ